MISFDPQSLLTVDDRWHLRGAERIIIRSPVLYMQGRAPWSINPIVRKGKRLGYITDGGSVPRLFRNIIDQFGKYYPIFVFHDRATGYQTETGLTFGEAVDLLHDGCIALDPASPKMAWTIAHAVKTFGKWIWERSKEHDGDESWHYAEIIA